MGEVLYLVCDVDDSMISALDACLGLSLSYAGHSAGVDFVARCLGYIWA